MATANYHDLLQTETLEYVCIETLNRTRDILEEDFDPLLVQNDLLLNGILTEKECEELKCKTRRRDRLKLFLTLLKNRHKTFHKFVDVLTNFKGYEALGSNLADQSLELKLYVEEVKELHNLLRSDRYSEEDQTYMIEALMDINKADAVKLLHYLKLNRHSGQLQHCNGLGFRPTFAKILYENNMACFQFRRALTELTQSMSISATKRSDEVIEADDRPPFDFYDMVDNVIKELTLSSIENMCECLKMSKSMRAIKESETPGRQFFIECRRKNIISRHDTQRLVEAANKCGLKTIEEIIEDYQRISCCPEIRVTLTCGSSSAATSNNFRDFFLNKKRELKAMFRRNHGAHFVDAEEGSIVVRLKVSNIQELERLIEHIKAGKVLESVKELCQSEVSENQLENVFGKVENVEISINETDISNAESYFSTDFSFSHSRSVSKSTETRTTTTVTTDIRQHALRSVMTELEEEFDPISLLPMLEEGDFFNEGEKDRLLGTSTRADRMRLFQSFLLSKPYSKFNEFVNALSECGHYMSLVKTLRSNLLETEKTEYIQTTVTSTEITREESSSHVFSRKTSVNTAKTDDVNLEAKSLQTGNKESKIYQRPMNVTDIVTKTTKDNQPSQGTQWNVTGAVPNTKEANKSFHDGASTATANIDGRTTTVDTSNDSEEVVNNQQPEDQNNTNSRDYELITQQRTADQYEGFIRRLGLTMDKKMSLVDSLVINWSDLKGNCERKMASPVTNVLSKLTCFDHRIQINALPSSEDHQSNVNSKKQNARETEENIGSKSKRDEPEMYYDAVKRLESETNSSCATNIDNSEDSQLSRDDEDSICDPNVKAISFRDGMYGIINSLDPFLLQDVIWKMSACQMAVPLLMPDPISEKLSVLLWGLRKIKKSWYVHGEAKIRTENVVDFPFLTVAALRLGKINQSKSNILNKLLGSCQGNQDNPYFSSYEQDSVTCFWSNGEVEAVWFLPNEDTRGNQITTPFCILNLRGDALRYKTQVKFAVKASFAIIVFLDCNCSTYQQILDDMKSSCHLIIVNCNQNVDPSKGSTSKRKKHYKDRTELFTKGLSPLQIGKLLSKILKNILDKNDRPKTSLIDSLTCCDSLNIEVDEQNSSCQEGKKLASEVVNNLVKDDNQISKKEVFPIQYCWKEFTKGKTSLSTGTEEEIAARNRDLKKTRLEQLSSKFSQNMMIFYKGVTLPKNEKQYFLGWLEIFLENVSVMTIQPLYEELKELSKTKQELSRQVFVTDLKSNEQSEQDTSLARKAREKLNIIQQFDEKSIGIEHFFRELAQLSEAYSHVNVKNLDPPISEKELSELPKVAAQLLLSGYTLELLDGDSNNLPLKWIENIFSAVSGLLGSDIKVYVLSVLGVQSSGKSTLLNAMFGVRFPVSAGRCTRGAFLQLLPIQDSLQGFLRCDYIAIVDTEGLKAPEKSITFSSTSEDNALATFALCISDLTLINIGGQTVGEDMTNILQIAAHAFIRMKEVNLNSECRIVQQFVADITATNKNEAATQSVVMKLDEAVQDAANLEGKAHLYKQFTDVFTLQNMENETTNVQYIPSLWRGYMGVPNSQYGVSMQFLKAVVLKGIRKNSCLTMTELGDRIGDVWHAISSENFVFSFQTTKEATLYDTFQSKYRKSLIPIRSKILEMRLAVCAAIKSSEENQIAKAQAEGVREITRILEKECKELQDKTIAELKQETYLPIQKHEMVFISDLRVFQSHTLRYTMDEIADYTEVTYRKTCKVDIVKKIREGFRSEAAAIAHKLREDIVKKLDTIDVSTQSNPGTIIQEFSRIWDKWIKTLTFKYPLPTAQEIRAQVKTKVTDSISVEMHTTSSVPFGKLENNRKAPVNSLTLANDFKQCYVEKTKNANSERLSSLREQTELQANDYLDFSNLTDIVLENTNQCLKDCDIAFGKTNFYLHFCSLFVTIAHQLQRDEEVKALMDTAHKSTLPGLKGHDEILENNIKVQLQKTALVCLLPEKYICIVELLSEEQASGQEKSKLTWRSFKHNMSELLSFGVSKQKQIKNLYHECRQKLDDMEIFDNNICSEESIKQYLDTVVPLLEQVKSQNLHEAVTCLILTGRDYFSKSHRNYLKGKVDNPNYVAQFQEPKNLFSLQSKIELVSLRLSETDCGVDEGIFSTFFSTTHISKLSSLPTSPKLLQLLDLQFLDILPNESFTTKDLQIIHNSMNHAKIKLLNHENGLAPFNQTLFAEIIAELNKVEVEKSKNEVKSAAILHIGEWVLSVSSEKTYEYEKSHNMVTLVAKERSSLQRFFQSLCYEHEDKITAERFCSEIVRPCILDGSIVKMLPVLLMKITNQCKEFISKRSFIGKALESLHGEYEGIIKFLSSFSKFGEEWTLNRVAEICTSNEAIAIASLCQRCLEDLIDSAIDSVKTCQKTFQSQSDSQLGNWLQSFSNLFHENTGLLCDRKEIDKLVRHFKVRKFDIFAKECQEIIEKMNGLISEMKLPPKNDIQKTKIWLTQFAPTFHVELFECVKGCPEQCPFCGAVCDDTLTEHSKHSALLHYPRGVNGRLFKDTQSLDPLICTSGVESTDQGYYTIHGDPEIRLYKDYEQDFPTWYIRGVKDHQPPHFWKYVFFKYNEKIAKSHNCKKAELPTEWGKITYDEALQSLRKAYNLSSE